MPENCKPNDCPLTTRVESLERANEQHGKTHREIFARLNDVEKDNAVQDARYQAINGKLDEISVTVKTLADRPAKRWESLVGYALSALVGAFLLWVASGMPGVGK